MNLFPPRLVKKLWRWPFEQITDSFRKTTLQDITRDWIYHSHQTGSHIILRNENPPHRRLTIPNHKEIAKGTLRAIIRQAGLTLEEFKELI